MSETIKAKIRTIPDWPKKNIMFKDITTLLREADGFKETIDILFDRYKEKEIDYVIGIESRGFIIGAPLAYLLKCGFIPIRKPGKLPADCECEEYDLEYGTDKIEIHKDAVTKGDNVLIVDDLLATGGTIQAAINLINRLEAHIIECAFIVELLDLKGRDKIRNVDLYSIVQY